MMLPPYVRPVSLILALLQFIRKRPAVRYYNRTSGCNVTHSRNPVFRTRESSLGVSSLRLSDGVAGGDSAGVGLPSRSAGLRGGGKLLPQPRGGPDGVECVGSAV